MAKAGGLGGLLGWSENPYYRAFDSRRNAIGQLGAGLASGKTWQEGIALGTQGALQGRQQDDAYAKMQAEEQKRIDEVNQTVEWMRSNGFEDYAAAAESGADIGPLFNAALQEFQQQRQPAAPMDPYTQQMNALKLEREQLEIEQMRNPQAAAGGNLGSTIYGGRDASGNIVPMQVSPNGGFVVAPTPEGVTFDPGAMTAERAAAAIDGKTQANAAAALPSAQQTAQQTLQTINALRNDAQGREETFGKVGGVYPQQMSPFTLPGSAKADFEVMRSQLQGQTFLQAREMLRGGGPITDYEGKRAEDAMARLSTAQSEPAFLQAMDDFEAAIRDGVAKLEMVANGETPPSILSQGGQQRAPSGSLRDKYGLE